MQSETSHETPVTQSQTPPTAADAAPTPALALRLARGAGVAVGLGLIFAWLGVYQTSQFPFAERVIYWTGLMLLGIVAGSLITPLITNRVLPRAHPGLQVSVASLLISIPVTIGLAVIEAASDGTVAPPEWWLQQYLYVLVISMLLTSLAWVVEVYAKRTAVAQPAPLPGAAPAVAAAAFLDRLPPKFRTAGIHAVSAEDHYLRVHTSAGETMILMRLADAIRELAGIDGLQVHRSWWVARQGLADATRTDGKLLLKLKSGAEAPVSRTYIKAVKDAGWL